MRINVAGKIIEMDDESYLLNPDDWPEKIAGETAYQQAKLDMVKLTETHWGLI